MREDVAPAVEQLSGAERCRTGSRGTRLPSLDRADRCGRKQIADCVGYHRDHRTKQPDRGAAKRWSERGGGGGLSLTS